MASVLALASTVGAVPAGAQPPAGPRPAAVLAQQQLGVVADFNGDRRTDLAVGAPGENVGTATDAGAVSVFGIDSGTGLPDTSTAVAQDNAEAGDQFGAALATGEFNGDEFFDLVVGTPGENVGATVDAGAANLFVNSTGALPSVSEPVLLQGNPESGDGFGAALDL
jgi:FG-GAP repeat